MSRGSIVFLHPHGGGLQIGPDHPDPTRSFIRGTEIALVRLAQELAQKDWQVRVFLEGGPVDYEDAFGVHWGNMENAETTIKALRNHIYGYPEVVVSLLTPEPFKTNSGGVNILWGHYAHLNVGRLDAKVHHYVLGTDWHQWSVCEHDRAIDPDKCVIIGSGFDLPRYANPPPHPIYGRMVYSSSADRGLHHILRFWPLLKASIPHVSLKVFYDPRGMEMWRWQHEGRAEMARIIDGAKNYDGVEFVGPVDPWTLAQEQMKEDLMVYPCDPVDRTETLCLSILERMAAGTPVLTTDADCLPEMYGNAAFFLPRPINDLQWVEVIGDLLSHREKMHSLVPVGKAIAEAFTWERIAERWTMFLEQRFGINHDDREGWLTLGEDVSNVQRVLLGRAAKMRYNENASPSIPLSPTGAT